MNENVIISAWFITTLLFVIILWKFILLEKYTKEVECRVRSLELDEFLRIAFQKDSERIDLYIRRQMEAIADRKIQEHKDKIKKKILGDLQ